MTKKLIFFLIVISLNCCNTLSKADNYHLVLSIQDLTWLSCEPNENIDKVIEKLRNNYDIIIDSWEYDGKNYYNAGDPTPAMSWILMLEKNRKDGLIGMEYGRFKKGNGGARIKTNKGIEYGSDISRVYDSYGICPVIDRRRDPVMNYVDLKYPFVLEKTGQKGNLIFTLHYKAGDSEKAATVIGLKWRIIA